MRRRAAFFAAVLLPLLVAPGCRDWRERVDPARAAAEPEQANLAGDPPIELEAQGHRIVLTPRARYRITGYAAEVSRKLLDRWDFAVPMDLALVWGPVADPTVLRHMKFHLSRRYVSYWYDGETPRGATGKIASHVANHHLIPASDEVQQRLDQVRIGDLVTLQGRLVDLEIFDAAGRSAHRAATSLTRDDVGSGACEQVYVESVEVERP